MKAVQLMKSIFVPSSMKAAAKEAHTVPSIKVSAQEMVKSADAMDAQGRAAVNMSGKKAYVKPESKTIKIEEQKMQAGSGTGSGTGDGWGEWDIEDEID